MQYYFAANLLSSLGIDWKLLITQGLAFLILLYILGKFVYPPLIKGIDARREQVEAGQREAIEARQALKKAEVKAEALLADARKSVDDLIARSQADATKAIAEAEAKAKSRADQIVADARTQLEADVRRARDLLKKEAINLVAVATEHVIGEKVDTTKDAALIKRALEKEPV